MSEQLLTARAIAETLDVTPATVLRWTRNGDLPAIRLPSGQIRYRAAAFEEWLAGRSLPARAADGHSGPDGAPRAVFLR